jgi:hypothetical protein
LSPALTLVGRLSWVAAAVGIAAVRLYIPTVHGNDVIESYKAILHIALGILICMAWFGIGPRWLWIGCVAVPSAVQAVMFFWAGPA